MNWKEELKQAYPNGLTCLKVCSDIGRDHIPGLEAFIESLLEQVIEDTFTKMPTAGESGDTIYLDVKEIREFKQQLKAKWLN